MEYGSWGRLLCERFPPRDPTTDQREWAAVKDRLLLGQSVTGTVFAKAPFGAWIDIGIGFSALLELSEIAGLTPEKYRADDWCPLGSAVTASVVGFRDENKQIQLSQVNLQQVLG